MATLMRKYSGGAGGVYGDEDGIGLGFVKYTRGLGRKRIVISNNAGGEESSLLESPVKTTPLKRQCSGITLPGCDKSALESLPQDILIRILCGVEHEDLDRLFHVSKAIREAALIAKQWHFAYSTPRKTPAFRTALDFEEESSWGTNPYDDIEPPNAPKQTRYQGSRISGKDVSSISMALFT